MTFSLSHHGWVSADWLINYAGGFCRRGLPGSIILALNQTLHIPVEFLIPLFQGFFFSSYLICFLLLIRDRKLIFNCLFLVTLPSFFLAYLWDRGLAGRKEVIFFSLYGLWCLCLKHKKQSHFTSIAFAAAVIMMVLSHELSLFFSGYFLFASWLYSKKQGQRFNWSVFLIPIAALISGLVLLNWGKPFSSPEICQSILSAGGSADFCRGILSYPVTSIKVAFSQFAGSISVEVLVNAVLALGVIFVPFLLIKNSYTTPVLPPSFLILQLGLVLVSFPLFVIGLDWGRWINIHTVLSITTLFLLIPKTDLFEKSERVSPLKVFFLIVSALSWQLNNCCPDKVFTFLGPWHQILGYVLR